MPAAKRARAAKRSTPTKLKDPVTLRFLPQLELLIKRAGSANKLAKRAGISAQRISDWREAGEESRPGRASLEKLASAYGVTIQWLSTGEGPESADESRPTTELEKDIGAWVKRHVHSVAGQEGIMDHWPDEVLGEGVLAWAVGQSTKEALHLRQHVVPFSHDLERMDQAMELLKRVAIPLEDRQAMFLALARIRTAVPVPTIDTPLHRWRYLRGKG